jgi:thioredoxin 1
MRNTAKCFSAIILITLFILGINSCAKKYKPLLTSANGVNFMSITLAEAKEKARDEHKPLFVFIHATWCPTCKKMEQEVLIKKELGDIYNRDFVNVAIDLDSPEGHKLNKLYPVTATPTLLFFNPDGSIANKTEGFTDVNGLLAAAHQLIKNN